LRPRFAATAVISLSRRREAEAGAWPTVVVRVDLCGEKEVNNIFKIKI
jgi:hypothetical protein